MIVEIKKTRNKKMTKLNKQQLTQRIESLQYVINESAGAIFQNELEGSVVRIQIRAQDLQVAMDKDLNCHAAKLLPTCEAQLDRATHYIVNLENRIKRMISK